MIKVITLLTGETLIGAQEKNTTKLNDVLVLGMRTTEQGKQLAFGEFAVYADTSKGIEFNPAVVAYELEATKEIAESYKTQIAQLKTPPKSTIVT